jgi:hypothetical protein
MATTCCYAVQDKARVHDPDGAHWEVYTVIADSSTEGGPGCSKEDSAVDAGAIQEASELEGPGVCC